MGLEGVVEQAAEAQRLVGQLQEAEQPGAPLAARQQMEAPPAAAAQASELQDRARLEIQARPPVRQPEVRREAEATAMPDQQSLRAGETRIQLSLIGNRMRGHRARRPSSQRCLQRGWCRSSCERQ